MQIEILPDDMLMQPLIGPGDLTREQALGEIQTILDRLTEESPGMRPLAETWRRGARDDTVYAGLFTWTVYEHPTGEDPRKAALEWLTDFAETMRSAGLTNIQLPRL